jgi:hypothetical protein
MLHNVQHTYHCRWSFTLREDEEEYVKIKMKEISDFYEVKLKMSK